jgi:hypothetical protein
MHPLKLSALAFALTTALAACGGGGGGGNNNGNQPDPGTDPNTGGSSDTTTLLPCVNTATIQCSGGSIVRAENDVAMTESGVQVYGRSTSDTVAPAANPNTTAAWGLEPDAGGIAEVRLERNANGAITRTGLLLRDIGITWDRQTSRPPVIEIFSTAQGRATLAADANRSIMFGPLPPSSDLNHYDWARLGAAGTQANYANNVYFPRQEPIRCPAGDTRCSEDYAEVAPKLTFRAGPWRLAGQTIETAADETTVSRLHEDGDLRAGDDVPGPNGERRWISDSDGFGVSYPGFKGYRSVENWSYQYVNLSNWLTQDTVEIVEWSGGANEHNKARRGFVAFGDVTPPANIPTGGTATYAGAIYGFFARSAVATSSADDADHFRGKASITVNFATRTATITFSDTNTFNAAATAVPASFTATALIGGANGGPSNYLSGSVTNTLRDGGIGARFFGPSDAAGPAEIGGTLSFTYTPAGTTTRQTVIGGFIARKQ